MLPSGLTGFLRCDGRMGIRNLVAVMAAADNVNPLVRKVAADVSGVTCLPASYGRGQLGRDLEITLEAMAGLAAHPNVAQCLIVSFEPDSAERIAERARRRGRGVQTLSLLEAGGLTPAMSQATEILAGMIEAARCERRADMPVEALLIGLECGGSDTSSGLFANPSLGAFTDRLIAEGGSAIFSEPVECLGGETMLTARAASPQAAQDIVTAIQRYRDIALSQGVDLTGINPTADNIDGGLTTIEEKSLGAIAKSGTCLIQGLIGYGERPRHQGLWLMDAPAAAVENLTALAAAGVQVILFATGSCNPVGHPVSPTIKVCANPLTMQRMTEHVDVDLSDGLAAGLAAEDGARRIADRLTQTIGGDATAAERLDYLETNISRFGQSV